MRSARSLIKAQWELETVSGRYLMRTRVDPGLGNFQIRTLKAGKPSHVFCNTPQAGRYNASPELVVSSSSNKWSRTKTPTPNNLSDGVTQRGWNAADGGVDADPSRMSNVGDWFTVYNFIYGWGVGAWVVLPFLT